MYVLNSFNVCGNPVSVYLTSAVYTVNPRFAFIRGGRFILSVLQIPCVAKQVQVEEDMHGNGTVFISGADFA